ncbi:hypothetical protein H310_06055 [Aphanomyces invadans]|uniref:Uncharacterized protein n=1 Tax=Aphanomyces invadans TaxID=157072 RepID=A0A024U813_9STRA|nr:hypothetical protein H310_06055 [Aphanomyces invadans]ETW02576.1 hypothetical protein H310_06055 [Aphanomyces invadans]|eukprot:XP_008869181.1 hypothetical protein H310_06055 [Aphanomyces invadans]
MNAAGSGGVGPYFMGGAGDPGIPNAAAMNFNMGFMMNSPGASTDGASMNVHMSSFGTNTGDGAGLTPPSTSAMGSAANSSGNSSFNRGNYRCSRCGEPKKGHVCPYQPANYKCSKCGNLKRSCTCGAPQKSNIEIQCAMDEHMTVARLDRSAQGVTDFHESIRSFVEGSAAS